MLVADAPREPRCPRYWERSRPEIDVGWMARREGHDEEEDQATQCDRHGRQADDRADLAFGLQARTAERRGG